MQEQDKIKLISISISGFKSFNSDEHTMKVNDVNVLIGANSAGKSNVISFFKMINYMMTSALQNYIGENGFAQSLLHYGAKKTPMLHAQMKFENEGYFYGYNFSLAHAAQDQLIFTNEELQFQIKSKYDKPGSFTLQPGGAESGLKRIHLIPERFSKPANIIHALLCNCRVYQFHDTSATANIRNSTYINQGDFLFSDGGNLASFLFALKQNNSDQFYYQKVVRRIKQVFPLFEDFNLRPSARNQNYIALDWFEKDNKEYNFGPHQLSDGTIRFMALATLLLQPPEKLPAVIVLDEPELGLHPMAIIELANMIHIASKHTQVILATQSPSLLDEFDTDKIIVVERNMISKSSEFKQLSETDLAHWKEEYTVSEMWDKNIFGGKP